MPYYDSSPPAHYDDPLARYDDPGGGGPSQPRRRMAKIALQLQKKKLDEKLVLCQSFETKLTGNANVPAPLPLVATLTAKRTAIIAKRADLAVTRETVLQLENDLNNLEKDLDGVLTQEAATIESATGGD